VPEEARVKIAETLNARLADGLDLHSQIKVAHWNIKGPQFAALHPLFETFAVGLALHNDTIAERAVTLGGKARGTSRHVAKTSRLPDFPQETTRDLEHVKLLCEKMSVSGPRGELPMRGAPDVPSCRMQEVRAADVRGLRRARGAGPWRRSSVGKVPLPRGAEGPRAPRVERSALVVASPPWEVGAEPFSRRPARTRHG
jgi:hypothetical protein